MALLALGAASTYLQTTPGQAVAALPASGTSLGANTGLTFINDENTILVIWVGAAGTGTVQFVPGVGTAPAAVTLANSSTYIFGPFPSTFNALNTPTAPGQNLVTVNFSVVTGNSASVYKLLHKGVNSPALHDPLEMNAAAGDF